MKNFKNILIIAVTSLILISFCCCNTINNNSYKKYKFVDKKVSDSTKKLYDRLLSISKKGFAIGHQDATSYGLGWKYEDDPTVIRSDVFEIVNDFPAVYGFDIGHIELSREQNLDSVPFDTMRKLIIKAHESGGIITISWHADNPTSGGTTWDKSPTVVDIIEGGKHSDKYKLWIKRVADFINSLEFDGKKIPIIFRPYHEMNGSWFWWGEGNCTADEYKKLWQETVHMLRDEHNLHNLLYAYSPNKLNPGDDYLKYYPGDDYVDILGIDIYDFNDSEGYIKSIENDLKVVKSIATEKNKLYAFTETGLEKIPTNKWFTDVLYPSIENSGISWILFWRNARKDHHYMPYKGHVSEENFIEFKALQKTLFLHDINNLSN